MPDHPLLKNLCAAHRPAGHEFVNSITIIMAWLRWLFHKSKVQDVFLQMYLLMGSRIPGRRYAFQQFSKSEDFQFTAFALRR
jgi:hypothetical protein